VGRRAPGRIRCGAGPETGLPLDVARFTVTDSITTPAPVGDGLRQAQLDILKRYKAAGIAWRLWEIQSATRDSNPRSRRNHQPDDPTGRRDVLV
jgi:hypothetical protein